MGYGYLSHLIPRTLERNIRVCAVGSHATAAMHTHRPDFEIGQLVYGLPDYAQDTFSPYDIGYAGGLPLFVSVGAFEMRKGQDVLVEAIRLLPASTRAKAAFLFVGKGGRQAAAGPGAAADRGVSPQRLLCGAPDPGRDQVPDGSVRLHGVQLPG